MKLAKIILAILVLVFIGQTIYFFPQLSETLASHFNQSGQANGFMSKTSFFVFEAAAVAVLVFVNLRNFYERKPTTK